MMLTPISVETLRHPTAYSPQQIDLAFKIARLLDRGKLVLVEPPARDA